MIPSFQAIEIATCFDVPPLVVERMIRQAASIHPEDSREAEDAVVRALAGDIPLYAILHNIYEEDE